MTILFLSINLFGHSGRTDKNGGHYNRKTGKYHYHGAKGIGSGLLWVIIIGGGIVFLVIKSSDKNEK